jgi:hypothetical protein
MTPRRSEPERRAKAPAERERGLHRVAEIVPDGPPIPSSSSTCIVGFPRLNTSSQTPDVQSPTRFGEVRLCQRLIGRHRIGARRTVTNFVSARVTHSPQRFYPRFNPLLQTRCLPLTDIDDLLRNRSEEICSASLSCFSPPATHTVWHAVPNVFQKLHPLRVCRVADLAC